MRSRAPLRRGLQRWGGITSELLYPPPPQRAYRCDGYGDYIFAVSRLAPLKRLSLLIDALANPEAAGIRCVIAGEGEERRALEHAIVDEGPFVARHADWPDRRPPDARAPREVPRRLLPALRRGLRVRHRRSVCVAQAGRDVHRQRGPGGAGHRRRERKGVRATARDARRGASRADGRCAPAPNGWDRRLGAGVPDDVVSRRTASCCRHDAKPGIIASALVGILLLAFAVSVDFPKANGDRFKGDESTYYMLGAQPGARFRFPVRAEGSHPRLGGIFRARKASSSRRARTSRFAARARFRSSGG